MLAQLAQRVSRLHQDMFVRSNSLSSPYDFETQRIWLTDVPILTPPTRLVQSVSVEFADGSTDTGFAGPHPTSSCLSIVRTLVYPAPLTKVFGPAVYYGRYEDLQQYYSASTTLFPFLFVLDTIRSSTDANVLHVAEFVLLLVGLADSRDSLSISGLNIVATHISNMLRNVEVKVNSVREYARISFEKDTFEVYIQAFECETYLLQRYV